MKKVVSTLSILSLIFILTWNSSYAGALDLLSSKKNTDAMKLGYLSEQDVYKSGDINSELINDFDLLRAVKGGDHDAEHRLGIMYYKGDGIIPNKAKAAYWFGKAALSGNPSSQTMLGLCFQYGDCGISINFKNAVFWYTKAADQGYDRAQTLLGMAYAEGKGVPVNYEEAAMWLRMAASQGYSQAQAMLGIWYINGKFIKRNYEEGIRLLKQAADQNDKEAISALQELEPENAGGPFAD